MGFSIETSVSAITVFIQGALSFFSPCVLPLVPLYVSYLASGTVEVDENGVHHYPRRRILINTLFYVLGIGFAFFLLGLGLNALSSFFSTYQIWFARISGVLIILFGLYQLGIGRRSMLLEQEHRLPFHLEKLSMNPLVAWLFGFTFSFAWTPCVGPTLSSVLLMASSSASSATGFLLIGVYTLGFVLPFLAVGLFTGTVLDFFRSHQNVVRYTVKIGAVLLIIMGIMTLTGFMSGLSGGLAGTPAAPSVPAEESVADKTETPEENSPASESAAGNPESAPEDTVEIVTPPAPDFTLVDQYGNQHTLADYKGKTVFLNFWATWCGPCRKELPDIQALYEDHGENQDDLVVLGVIIPQEDEGVEGVTEFLEENELTFPSLMDVDSAVSASYGIRAFPTTFMINTEGNVFGYVSGALSRTFMDDIVQQTQSGVRK